MAMDSQRSKILILLILFAAARQALGVARRPSVAVGFVADGLLARLGPRAAACQRIRKFPSRAKGRQAACVHARLSRPLGPRHAASRLGRAARLGACASPQGAFLPAPGSKVRAQQQAGSSPSGSCGISSARRVPGCKAACSVHYSCFHGSSRPEVPVPSGSGRLRLGGLVVLYEWSWGRLLLVFISKFLIAGMQGDCLLPRFFLASHGLSLLAVSCEGGAPLAGLLVLVAHPRPGLVVPCGWFLPPGFASPLPFGGLVVSRDGGVLSLAFSFSPAGSGSKTGRVFAAVASLVRPYERVRKLPLEQAPRAQPLERMLVISSAD